MELMISNLKRKARKEYKAYQSVVSDYSCGNALAEHISPRASKHRLKFNKIMADLARIDPNCPKARL